MRTDILTSAGNYFDFLDPAGSRFGIEEIAHALSHICRYTGHVRHFYSVAKHSVHVSDLVPEADALGALLHDAAEAFIGDVSSPLKQLLPEYKVIERRVETAVLARFGLPPDLDPCVKYADLVMLATEKRDLMPATTDQWEHEVDGQIQPVSWTLEPLDPERARLLFLRRFWSIKAAS